MKEKILYVMCGVPGSGKTYFAKNILIHNNPLNTWYVSRDEIRFNLVKEDEPYFNKERKVFNDFIKTILEGLLDESISVVIADATHLNWASRKKLFTALKLPKVKEDRNIKIIPVYFYTPVHICLERNNQRGGRTRVPEEVIRNMEFSKTTPWLDPFEYDAVMEVRT